MPATLTRHIAVPRRGNREAASFVAQLDDQTRRLKIDLRGIRAAELEWQPHRGANTIGMLLAHMAIVEVYWTQVAEGIMSHAGVEKVLQFGVDDDGMPLPPRQPPSANLKNRTLGYYYRLLARARRYVRGKAPKFSDAEMERFVVRQRRDGKRTRHSVRWIFYHVLEHFSGHYGQILLLRHLYKDRKEKA